MCRALHHVGHHNSKHGNGAAPAGQTMEWKIVIAILLASFRCSELGTSQPQLVWTHYSKHLNPVNAFKIIYS